MKRLLFSLIFALLLSAPLWGQSYLYYGYGCNGTSSNTCTVGSSNYNNGLNSGQAIPITTGSNALGYTVLACGVNWVASGTNFICAIYAAGSSTSPISSCTMTTGVGSASGWVENTNFSGCTLAASTNYYLVVTQNNSTAGESYNGVGTAYGGEITYGTWPAPLTWTGPYSFTYSYYIRVTANAAAVVRHRAQVIQ